MKYDSIIIGAGIAGVSAAVYSKYFGLQNVLLLEADVMGGKIALKGFIDNIPFTGHSYSNDAMVSNMQKELDFWKVEQAHETVKMVNKVDNNTFEVITNLNTYETKTVVMAVGHKLNRLGVPGDISYQGKGVYYMSAVHKGTFGNKTVAFVGGGRASMEFLLYMDSLKAFASGYLISDGPIQKENDLFAVISGMKNVTIIENAKVTSITGDGKLADSLNLEVNGKEMKLAVTGIFPNIGYQPDTSLAMMLGIDISETGRIVQKDYQTSMPGIFAIGDIIDKRFANLITASADGMYAALAVAKYVNPFFDIENYKYV